MEEQVMTVAQEFYGEDYFLYKEIEHRNKIYHVFSKISDPSEIIVAEKQIENDEEVYIIITGELYLEIIGLCKKED